jgi:hypothetical protein
MGYFKKNWSVDLHADVLQCVEEVVSYSHVIFDCHALIKYF